MKITIIGVGKIKEKYLTMAINEYTKRISRYSKVEIFEVSDEKTPQGASVIEENHIKDIEGSKILKLVKSDTYLIALAIDGDSLSSVAFANKIKELGLKGKSHITFIIGGSLGLSDKVLERADYLLSFSNMTFPHQLMRVILLEQIYRGFRINTNQPYHK